MLFWFGDKRRVIHQMAGILLIAFAAATVHATDNNTVWSFENHPHPGLSDMTVLEKSALLSVKKRSPNGDISCRASLQTEYEIYLDRYPGYFAAYDERERLKHWKRHMAQNPNVQELTCLYGHIEFRLSELNDYKTIGDDFLFCDGRYPRAPLTIDEHELVSLLNELIVYAHLGSKEAALKFAGASAYGNVLKASPDLDYYFLSFANRKNPSENLSRRRASMAELITPKRLEFLDEAVRTGAYETVVETLPVCNP